MRRAPALLALLALLALAACGGDDAAGWERVETPPLSPRVAAVTFSAGTEAFVVGGDTEPCHPAASCVMPRVPPLADGAAFDAATGTWRRIADAPVPFEWAEVEVFGDSAYLWITGSVRPGTSTAFLAYRIREDRWDTLPLPALSRRPNAYEVGRAGRRILAATWTDAGDTVPEQVFDPESETWSAAPAELRFDPRPAPPADAPFFLYRGALAARSGSFFRTAGLRGRYDSAAGWAYDDRTGEWFEIPPLDPRDGSVDGRAVASAGGDLLLVGGVRWGASLENRLLDEAWLWRAPR